MIHISIIYKLYILFVYNYIIIFQQKKRYTRNLIDEGNGKFNILLLCWAESQGSSIHDHSNSHCFMKCLDGELVETKYEWPSNSDQTNEKEMIVKTKTELKRNQVCYINGNFFSILNIFSELIY